MPNPPRHLRAPADRLEDIRKAPANSRDYALRLTLEVEVALLTLDVVSPWGPIRIFTLPAHVAQGNGEITSALGGMTTGPGIQRVEAGGLVVMTMPLTYTRVRALAILDAELVKL